MQSQVMTRGQRGICTSPKYDQPPFSTWKKIQKLVFSFLTQKKNTKVCSLFQHGNKVEYQQRRRNKRDKVHVSRLFCIYPLSEKISTWSFALQFHFQPRVILLSICYDTPGMKDLLWHWLECLLQSIEGLHRWLPLFTVAKTKVLGYMSGQNQGPWLHE